MKGSLHIIRANDDEHERVDLDKPASLAVLKAAIDNGYIEAVPSFDVYEGQRCVAFCDEEGKLKGLPLNRLATIAWCQALKGRPNITAEDLRSMGDVLCGSVVICTGDDEFMENL